MNCWTAGIIVFTADLISMHSSSEQRAWMLIVRKLHPHSNQSSAGLWKPNVWSGCHISISMYCFMFFVYCNWLDLFHRCANICLSECSLPSMNQYDKYEKVPSWQLGKGMWSFSKFLLSFLSLSYFSFNKIFESLYICKHFIVEWTAQTKS